MSIKVIQGYVVSAGDGEIVVSVPDADDDDYPEEGESVGIVVQENDEDDEEEDDDTLEQSFLEGFNEGRRD